MLSQDIEEVRGRKLIMNVYHSLMLLAAWVILLGGVVWGRQCCKRLKADMSPDISKLVNSLLRVILVAGLLMILPLAALYSKLFGFY